MGKSPLPPFAKGGNGNSSPFEKGGLRGISLPVQYLKGVGPRRAELLSKLGIKTVRDALYYLPARYEDRSSFRKVARIRFGEPETVSGVVTRSETLTTSRRRFKIFELTVRDDTGSITGVWFNQPFMQKNFSVGQRVILYGVPKPDQYKGYRPVIENPEYEVLEGDGEGGDEAIHVGRVVPVYRSTAGLSVRQLRAFMKHVVDEYSGCLADFLPDGFHDRFRIPALPEAIREAHFPERETDITALNSRSTRALKRLVFDEFFLLELGLARLKSGRAVRADAPVISGDGRLTGRLLEALPFSLTPGQERAVADIKGDMARPEPMNRLLQGDVGSGKTVVALMAILGAAEAGYQSALMAPTEILAEQHFLNIKGRLEALGLKVVLLTSSLKKKVKEAALREIAEGEAALAVGTHSLIQEGVAFKRLGLAVIDEQHRFGVLQRATLGDKGKSPHVLVMTATPIPRTLAMTVYGDLDVSVIPELPPGRRKIATKLFDDKSRAEAYRLIKAELAKGRQAYVVYSLVEESERSDLKAAKEGAERLANEVFPGVRVGLVHGKMKPAEKEKAMGDFRAGEVKILVATTVIEVGVDVPDATVMVIEHAERFGLSQLHQLRGRVGRSSHQSFCVLVASGFSDPSRARLSAMLKTADGFEIAEEDLELRGPGEFLGTRQSGLPEITVGNIIRDQKVLSAARKEAFDIIARDPGLSLAAHAGLRAALKEKWEGRVKLATVG